MSKKTKTVEFVFETFGLKYSVDVPYDWTDEMVEEMTEKVINEVEQEYKKSLLFGFKAINNTKGLFSSPTKLPYTQSQQLKIEKMIGRTNDN